MTVPTRSARAVVSARCRTRGHDTRRGDRWPVQHRPAGRRETRRPRHKSLVTVDDPLGQEEAGVALLEPVGRRLRLPPPTSFFSPTQLRLLNLRERHPDLRMAVTEMEPQTSMPAACGDFDLVLAAEHPSHPLPRILDVDRDDLLTDQLNLVPPRDWAPPASRPGTPVFGRAASGASWPARVRRSTAPVARPPRDRRHHRRTSIRSLFPTQLGSAAAVKGGRGLTNRDRPSAASSRAAEALGGSQNAGSSDRSSASVDRRTESGGALTRSPYWSGQRAERGPL